MDLASGDLAAGDLGGACLAAFGAALLAAWLLPRLARASGWLDRPDSPGPPGDPEAGRKLQRRPVPAVGGAIALAGALAGWAVLELSGSPPALGEELLAVAQRIFPEGGERLWPLAGLLTAFGVGLADDLWPGGLRPATKLAGQACAGLALGWPFFAAGLGSPGELGALCLVVLVFALAAVVATNAVNTFDNADGAAGMLVALAALASDPIVAAALVPFLALNLWRRADGEVGAYLGDSGSHWLGLWILITPAAWPVLVLPLADLVRLVVLRLKSGSRPWRGDRRHLAHRLLRRGIPRLWVPVLLAALALPTVLFGFHGAPWTLAGFALALALGDRAAGSGGCPGSAHGARERGAACSGRGPGG
jgi:UDP-N-acetylmuramyl pentapeptide phosphotransferase/UDP-N-acetylglucosamine-1-phosphate transferase